MEVLYPGGLSGLEKHGRGAGSLSLSVGWGPVIILGPTTVLEHRYSVILDNEK